jgi:hypothetical protein
MFAAYLDALSPSQRRDFACEFERRLPDILKRSELLARNAKGDLSSQLKVICRYHSTRH